MDRKLLKKLVLPLAAAAILFTGCGSTGNAAAETVPMKHRVTLTQEETVRKKTFQENQDFSEFLESSRQGFYIPGLAQHMIPQGISASGETGLTYISSYAASPLVSSVITAVDSETGVLKAEYWLYHPDGSPFSGHVGGLAAAGNYLYLSAEPDESGSYRIAQIDLGGLPREGGYKLTLDTFFEVQTKPSFLNASEGYLLVGNFYHPKGKYDLPDTVQYPVTSADGEQGCFILGYKLTDRGEPVCDAGRPKAEFVLSAPDRIQGICCREDRIYLSQSYGRKNNSSIYQYSVQDLAPAPEPFTVDGEQLPLYFLDSRSLCKQLTAMPMTEGLCIGPDQTVLVLFESGAKKYSDGRDRTDRVWYLNGQ